MLEGDRRGPGGPVAHRDPPEVVGVEDGCRNRAQNRGFQWASAERNDGFPAIEDELVQFLWLGYFPRRAESLELNGGSSGALKRRRGISTGARVSEHREDKEFEEERGNLGFIPGGGRAFIGHGGRWLESWRGRTSTARQRAASSIVRLKTTGGGCVRSGTLTGLPWAGSWWASLTGHGQVSSLPFFFCFFSFILFPVFYFAISNTNLLICFAGFWVWNNLSNMNMTLRIQHIKLDKFYVCLCT
jgi:hypothetical protein